MGHIGVKGLRSAVEGINFDDSEHESCQICARANIKRKPFPKEASHRATRLLQRVHCDICGPLPPSYGGFRHFILFICCYSRYIFISPMKSREEAPDQFMRFKALAETFSQQKITILRVDNAPELVRGKLEEHCRIAGISYKKTIPHSPSQNGVAERCNLTLVSIARALLFDASMSEWFWPFAILTAAHIKNRVPHSNLPTNTTPFELWYQYKPDLSHLRLFGAPCTSRILTTHLSKFDPRGEHGRFLGYARDAKGYLIWVPNSSGVGGTVKTRRDVIFHDFPSPALPDDSLPLWDDIAVPDNTKTHTAYAHPVADTLPLFNVSPDFSSERTPYAPPSHDNSPREDVNVDTDIGDNLNLHTAYVCTCAVLNDPLKTFQWTYSLHHS